MKTLDGKVAIVTGGSRGIGRAIVERLARMGAAVVINFSQASTEADQLALEIQQEKGRVLVVQADLQYVAEVEKLFDRCLAEYGHVDILVNNAGVALYQKIEDFTESDFDRTFGVNVKGLFFACQQAARKMADGGRIINISSTVTKVMLPTYGGYAASKGAVDQITKVLARELGERNIAVNGIAPGPVDTSLFRRGKTEEQIASLASMAAFGRIGTVEDIADCVSLLVSDESGWITGQTICANGGFAA